MRALEQSFISRGLSRDNLDRRYDEFTRPDETRRGRASELYYAQLARQLARNCEERAHSSSYIGVRITGSLHESAHRAQKMSAYYRGLLVKREILPSSSSPPLPLSCSPPLPSVWISLILRFKNEKTARKRSRRL